MRLNLLTIDLLSQPIGFVRKAPRLDFGRMSALFLSLSRDTPVIFGDGEQSRDFTYVENVVDAALRACTAPAAAGNVINVGVGRSYTLNQTIALLKGIFNRQVQPRFDPPRKGDVLHSLADISLARQALGYEPRLSFEEGLRRTVEWYRAEAKNSK